jgi:hypothetical protein
MNKFINYQYLRKEVDITDNVPDKELDNPIKRSQEMLEMIIGSDLYDEIYSQYPNSLSAANTTLMTYIKKFMAWQAYQFWIPKANFKDTRSGFRVMVEDNSVAATEKDMATLIRDVKSWAQTQKEKLVQFLEDNYASYPLYDYSCNSNKRAGTGFHITAVGKHKKDCKCSKCCHGHT